VFDCWLVDFETWSTETQKVALRGVLQATIGIRGVLRSDKSPEQKQFQAAEAAFRSAISEERWEEYRVRAQKYIRNEIDDLLLSMRGNSPAHFDFEWAERWVCKRAHDLGWTREKFGEFDRVVSRRDYDRHSHRTERIGKKYQRLALSELTARMADNLLFLGMWTPKPGVYGSALEVGLRDIDPSLLISNTHDDGWKQWRDIWWVPVRVTLASISPEERLAWRDSENDIINYPSLIEVRNPKNARRLLVLNNFSCWQQHGIADGSSELQRETWFRLNCVVVRKDDEDGLLQQLCDKRLTASHDLAELELDFHQYIGEYPWHPSMQQLPDWNPPGSYRALSIKTRCTVAEYVCEKGGYDYSIDDTIRVSLPAPWLVRGLRLRLGDGRKLQYVDPRGEVLFFDASVSEPGPQAALVDHDAFFDLLDREGLSALWIIAGEKSVYSGQDPAWVLAGGWCIHTFISSRMGDLFVVTGALNTNILA
jgi:hypothetical protein